MPTSHGKNAVLYLGTPTASPVAQTNNISLSLPTDYADASVHGNRFRQYVPGLKDYNMTVESFYDDTYFTMLDAAFNDTALNHYFYPNRGNTANYFYGQVYLSIETLEAGVDDMVGESWSIVPASDITFRRTP